MSGTAGYFRRQCPVKSPALIPTRVIVKITLGIKSPSAPGLVGRTTLRGKSKYMFLVMARCIAAFPDSMGRPGFVLMNCVYELMSVGKQGKGLGKLTKNRAKRPVWKISDHHKCLTKYMTPLLHSFFLPPPFNKDILIPP